MVWSPSSKYTEVNISYSGGGLLSAIHRGDWSERLEYENDRVVSRTWINGKIWSYTYADKVRGVLIERKTCAGGDVRDSFSLYHAEICLMDSYLLVFVFAVNKKI